MVVYAAGASPVAAGISSISFGSGSGPGGGIIGIVAVGIGIVGAGVVAGGAVIGIVGAGVVAGGAVDGPGVLLPVGDMAGPAGSSSAHAPQATRLATRMEASLLARDEIPRLFIQSL
jgi:hypothetical protein